MTFGVVLWYVLTDRNALVFDQQSQLTMSLCQFIMSQVCQKEILETLKRKFHSSYWVCPIVVQMHWRIMY